MKLFGLIVVLLNGAYFIWLSFNIIDGLGWVLFFAEIIMGSLTIIFLINHWSQHRVIEGLLPAKGLVDIFLPVVNESVDLSLTPFVGINIIWMALMGFWFAPVIRKGWLLE